MSVLTQIADSLSINPSEIGVNDPVMNTNNLVDNILNPVYAWAGILCVLVIVIAGFFFVTSSGTPATVKRAKDAILGAVIGLVIIIVAFTVTQFVLGRFQ
jgi:cytochrome bd-type quinol oxidase subunit 2